MILNFFSFNRKHLKNYLNSYHRVVQNNITDNKINFKEIVALKRKNMANLKLGNKKITSFKLAVL